MSVFERSISYRPFRYPWAVEMAKKHTVDMYWDVHQVELQDDLIQYNSANGLATPNVTHKQNKNILDFNLSLFTELDKTVGEGYTKILSIIGNNEIRNLLMTFAAREVVHQRGYALASETFGFPDDSWTMFREYVEMQDKIDIMVGDGQPAGNALKCAEILIRILLGEGIALFAAFASLLNLKRQGLLMGFNDVNQWSLKDEQEHVTGNIRILAAMRKDFTEVENLELDQFIRDLVKAYVACEIKYVQLLYKMGPQEDLPQADMEDYIGYLGELRLYQLGLITVEEVRENRLPWMEWLLTGTAHDNFFEKKVTDYSHGGLSGGAIDYSKYL